MNHRDLYKEYSNIKNFATLSKVKQNRIIDLLKEPAVANNYYLDSMVSLLVGVVDDSVYFDLAKNILINSSGRYTAGNNTDTIFGEALRINHQLTKDLLVKSKARSFNKLILICNNISIDEEVKGLRSISLSKYIPGSIHRSKYKPSLKALLGLPPIMRLKTLETLTYSRRVKYNIFEHIPSDDFKALLFTSTLKYPSRVEDLCEKYDEYKYIGIESNIVVSANCKQCGEYKINIKSSVVRTKVGLKNIPLGRYILSQVCVFCSSSLTGKPEFVENN